MYCSCLSLLLYLKVGPMDGPAWFSLPAIVSCGCLMQGLRRGRSSWLVPGLTYLPLCSLAWASAGVRWTSGSLYLILSLAIGLGICVAAWVSFCKAYQYLKHNQNHLHPPRTQQLPVQMQQVHPPQPQVHPLQPQQGFPDQAYPPSPQPPAGWPPQPGYPPTYEEPPPPYSVAVQAGTMI